MTIVVSLDLNDPVSLRVLKQFVSFFPQDYDQDKDLRSTDAQGIVIRSLDILLSGPDIDVPPTRRTPPEGPRQP